MLALNYLNLASGGLSKLGKHENTELSQSWRKIQKILIYHNFSIHSIVVGSNEVIAVKKWDGDDFKTDLALNRFLMKDWADEEGDESENIMKIIEIRIRILTNLDPT